jgi:hypothetical protein
MGLDAQKRAHPPLDAETRQGAEPTVIEGDTRPVRLDSPPVEVPIEATP